LVSTVSAHLDVSRHSPSGSPAVLHQPVSSSGVSSPSDGQDSVVKSGGRAGRLVVNSSRVELERGVRSINGNGDRLKSNSVQKSVLRSRSNIGVGGEGGTNVVPVESAGVGSSGGVRVRSFGVNTSVLDDVLESLIHETTVASLVSFGGGAVDEVLLGEGDEVLGGQEVGTFSGTSGRERPARSALSLVLDVGDGTVLSPIPRGRDRHIDIDFSNSLDVLGDVHAASPSGELLSGLVGEFIDSNGEASSLGVKSVNEVIVVSEDGESVLGFGERLVHFAIVSLPLVEGFSVFTFGEGKSTGKEGDEK